MDDDVYSFELGQTFEKIKRQRSKIVRIEKCEM